MWHRKCRYVTDKNNILKNKGIKTYRDIKIEITRNKKKTKRNKEQKRSHKINYKNIGETKNKTEEILRQHQDDVRQKRDINAKQKYIQNSRHKVGWKEVEDMKQKSRGLVTQWKLEEEGIRRQSYELEQRFNQQQGIGESVKKGRGKKKKLIVIAEFDVIGIPTIFDFIDSVCMYR